MLSFKKEGSYVCRCPTGWLEVRATAKVPMNYLALVQSDFIGIRRFFHSPLYNLKKNPFDHLFRMPKFVSGDSSAKNCLPFL